LNRWADEGDAETITKKINGGKNGLADRFDRLARISLVPLGYRADNVLQFKADQRLQVDGYVGPKTRAAMHTALVALTPGEAARPEVTAAPVTEKKPVPITPTQPLCALVEVERGHHAICHRRWRFAAHRDRRHTVAEPSPDLRRVRCNCRLSLLAEERRSEGRGKGRGDGVMFSTPLPAGRRRRQNLSERQNNEAGRNADDVRTRFDLCPPGSGTSAPASAGCRVVDGWLKRLDPRILEQKYM
jgi:hypothetical protein